ncbi:glutamine-rich protein 2-like [Rhynochetos jubatus]
MQATIVQVQGDCEKLSSVTGKLLHEQQQNQKGMEALFRSLERLQKDKADQEDVELRINVKVHKAALAGKVCLGQFEACMERQKETIQEKLSRVTEQEQGWQQLRRQLQEAMESKLDRLELGPLRQQLEQCRSIVEQLQKARQVEGEDADGVMKKQLPAHFHGLSCDRPLNRQVSGLLPEGRAPEPSAPPQPAGYGPAGAPGYCHLPGAQVQLHQQPPPVPGPVAPPTPPALTDGLQDPSRTGGPRLNPHPPRPPSGRVGGSSRLQ